MSSRILRAAFLFTALLHPCVSPVYAQATAPKISGFVILSYQAAEETDSAMNISSVRTRVRGNIDEKTEYTFFVDAVRDDILLDAAICRTIIPSLTLTAGQFKTPFSTDNLLPAWKYPFIARGFLKSAVSPPFRDVGMQLTHTTEHMELIAAVMNGAGLNTKETNGNKAVTCRAVGQLTPWLSLSGNYSRGEVTDDGEISEFYNAGCDGTVGTLWYEGEYARKEHAGVTAQVVAAWMSYDLATGFASLPTFTPAVKYEWYDPDSDVDNVSVTRYTVGMSMHLSGKDKNRIMMNYELEDAKVGDDDSLVRVTYLVRF